MSATTGGLPAEQPGRQHGRTDPQAPWRWVGTLFFAEGLPATVIGVLSIVLFKHLGAPHEDIAFFASGLTLPWILRPLWSPLLEVLKANRLVVVVAEALLALAFPAIAIGLTADARIGIALVLLAFVAVTAATHDMAADGLYVALSAEAQARYVGWLSVAFNIAKLTVQGLLLMLVGALEVTRGRLFGWRVVFAVLGAAMAVLALYHARHLPDTDRDGPRVDRSAIATASAVVTGFFQQRGIASFVALILLYRLAEGQLIRIVPLLLMDGADRGGLGLSTTQVGAFYGGLGACAFMAGALLGGWLSARFGLRRTLLPLCAAFNLPALIYLLLAWAQPGSVALVGSAIAAEQLAYGAGSVALKLIMMRAVADGPYRTAHFAFAGGLAGLCATAAGMLSGRLQVRLGYVGFFAWTVVVAAPVLVTAWISSRRLPEQRRAGPTPPSCPDLAG